VVSVVFCDLAGFTAHTERSDPEDVRARLTAFHNAVRMDVERFGGRIEKLMGDGVFAVFGAPTAHEDDPERAVQAALRIVDSLELLNEERRLGLEVRIAVTTGEAVVQVSDRLDREGIVGDVVNTASRLESVAAPGTIVVDERTFRATMHSIEHTALDPVSLKGKAEPLSIWRAEAARSRYGVAVDDAPDTPFVGRAAELALLVDAFERTIDRSQPLIVTITGEPGVGKSRLIREFRNAVDDRDDLVFWRQGRCLPYGETVSFWAIGEIVKSHAGILESEAPESALSKLEEAVAILIDDPQAADWVTLRLRPLVGAMDTATDGIAREELFTAWTRFFAALAAKNPLVMVLEDLHWADEAVVEFVDHLTEWATDSPILLVATARPELFTDRPDWAAGKRDAVTATLAALSDEDSVRLMAALTDRPVMSAEVQQRLLTHSGGNPLYVTEYVRLATEQDWFSRADRGEDLPLPDSIHSIIAARIDLLNSRDKSVLQTAAVVGRVFWPGALTFADAGTADDVKESLRSLIRREMIRPVRRSSMQGEDEYTFSHILIRDVAYGRLTRDERARLHGTTARWLEAVNGERASDVAELIAHHLATSYDLTPGDDADTERRIHRFLMVAIERASVLDAPTALVLSERAVEFATDDRERGRALVELATQLFSDTARALSCFDEAIACFERAADREGEVHALTKLARLRWFMGDGDVVDELDQRLLALVEGLPPSVIAAEAILAVAANHHLRGREEESLELVDRGLKTAQAIGDTKTYARALVIRGSALTQMGESDGAADIEDGLRIQLDRNDAPAAIRTYNNYATYLNDSGNPRASQQQIEAAITLGEQRGLTSHVDWSHLTLLESLFAQGEWDRMRSILDHYSSVERIKGTQIEVAMNWWRSMMLHCAGRSDKAWELMTEVLRSTRSIKDPQGLVPTLAHGIACAFEAGEDVTTRDLIRELAEVARDHPTFLALHLQWAAEAMAGLGMIDTLVDLNRRAARTVGWLDQKLAIVDAVIATAEGRQRDTVDLLDPLIVEADQRNEVVVATIARIEAGRAWIELEDCASADPLLDRAIEDSASMGAELFVQRVEEIRGGSRSATGT
jgi:class 3 adenylate cyclase/tetratricopeptide (TPR) repeat protein